MNRPGLLAAPAQVVSLPVAVADDVCLLAQLPQPARYPVPDFIQPGGPGMRVKVSVAIIGRRPHAAALVIPGNPGRVRRKRPDRARERG